MGKTDTSPSYRDEMSRRLRLIEATYKNRAAAAAAAETSKAGWAKWIYKESAPSFEAMRTLSINSKIPLEWIAFGVGDKIQYVDDVTNRDIGNRQIRRHLLGRIFVAYKALHKEFGYEEDEAETMRAVLDFYDDLVMFDDENVVTNMLASMMRWERQTLEKYKVKASKDN